MKEVKEVYVISTLDGRVQIDPGIKCEVVSENGDEVRISYSHGPNLEPKEAIVPKAALGLDMSSLSNMTVDKIMADTDIGLKNILGGIT